jgi:hypothetical protein
MENESSRSGHIIIGRGRKKWKKEEEEVGRKGVPLDKTLSL